jgi:tetratricopeptide (TPR) repeat protein
VRRGGAKLTPVLLTLILTLAMGCGTRGRPDPTYRPTESVLEAVSLLRLHVDDDTYRFPPARDFTGKNVYRAVLERLESLEEIHEAKFQSGYLTGVMLFAKARALERLGEYDLAAKHYRRVTDLRSILIDDARRSEHVCERLSEARVIRPEPVAPTQEALQVFDRRSALLEELLEEVEETHYTAIVREEIERADVERARYYRARRLLNPALETLALQQYQRLIRRHRESKLRNRHLLELADFYAELARDYAHRFPPPSLSFDPATFDEYAFGATRVYEAVAHQDGAVEKIEAARKLEAFLAFSIGVRDASLQR